MKRIKRAFTLFNLIKLLFFILFFILIVNEKKSNLKLFIGHQIQILSINILAEGRILAKNIDEAFLCLKKKYNLFQFNNGKESF